MKLIGQHHVRLDDGTMWAVDRDTDDHGTSLEWVLRYGSTEEREDQRLVVASVVGTFRALLCKQQRRRNQIMSELQDALDEWDKQVQAAPPAVREAIESGVSRGKSPTGTKEPEKDTKP